MGKLIVNDLASHALMALSVLLLDKPDAYLEILRQCQKVMTALVHQEEYDWMVRGREFGAIIVIEGE